MKKVEKKSFRVVIYLKLWFSHTFVLVKNYKPAKSSENSQKRMVRVFSVYSHQRLACELNLGKEKK